MKIQAMIDAILSAIIKNLNNNLKSVLNSDTEPVMLTSLVDTAGNPPVGSENKVLCSVVNLVQEKLYSEYPTINRSTDQNPAVNLNLYLIFAASFNSKNYLEGLRLIAAVIGFFQGKKLFLPSNTPNLPNAVDKITMEIQNLEMNELSHFWGALGAKYMPSIIYKVRMISISQDRVKAILPTIKKAENDLGLST